MRAIGLLGGTFDPVHVGHLRLAVEVRERMHLDEVRLLPAPQPRLRDAPTADPQTRLRLLRAAIEEVPGLGVDPREIDRPGPTRTVETLEELRAELGEQALCLILGADAAARLHRWYQWRRLPQLAHLIIARRPGAELPASGPVAELLAGAGGAAPQALRSHASGLVQCCDIPSLDVSATGIRERLASGRSIDFLVPDRVKHMLLNEGLYAHG